MVHEHSLTRGDRPVIAAQSVFGDLDTIGAFALEHTRMPMAVSDPRLPDNPLVMVNGSFLDQTGYEAGEVIGRNCRFPQGPQTDPRDVAAIREAVSQRRPLTIDILNYRKDGRPFVNELHVTPVYDHDGELRYYFASQLDVTEQRKTHALQDAEHALLLEVDHRAKNALALVQGIVRLSGRDQGIDAYAEAISGRIDALSVAHGLLSDARWQDVSVDRLVRALASSIGRARIETDGPGPMLSADQVQPLAIALHELLIDAVHDSSSQDEGQCLIRWHRDDAAVSISLTEQRRDSGRRAAPDDFGARIVEQVVRRQLGGTVARDWHGDRSTTTLTLPARAA